MQADVDAGYADAASLATLKSEVDEQTLVSVYRAIARDVGDGIGNFGGHVYQCKNGHPFFVGECGGVQEASRCVDCGEPVGGQNYRLEEGNTVAHDFIARVGAVAVDPVTAARQLQNH